MTTQFRQYIALAGVLLLSSVMLFRALPSSCAEVKKEGPEQISVDLHVRSEWLLLPPSGDAPTATRSALRVLRAIDPEKGEPYDDSKDVFGCNPAELRRAFLLEKEEFLLGEPLLVELRIELDGAGEWREPIGGNYRARGRDDNFLFLMRHEDGTWVRDPYAPINVYMGGISSFYKITQNEPQSHWLAVQRWCAIDRPGTYHLYCFQKAHGYEVLGQNAALAAGAPDYVKRDHFFNEDGTLIDSGTGNRSERYSITSSWVRYDCDSPLVEHIPADIIKYAGKSWSAQMVTDFAHFRITVKQGTERERQEMVEYWTRIAASEGERHSPPARHAAAIYGIQFAQQDDFIPLIEKWIADETRSVSFAGLAMRPNPEVADILLESGDPNAVGAMRFLHPEQVSSVIPDLIQRLTHEDNRMRAQSEARLRAWTGQSFYHTWRGYHYQRPTPEEGRKMQPAWEQWWEKNRDTFKPRTQ